jgi:hypothetical protein
MPSNLTSERRRVTLLFLGALAGVVLAIPGLIEDWTFPNADLPSGVVARVADRHISEDRFAQVLHDLAADKHTPLTETDRRFVLDRLIDEELLMLRGIELDLPKLSPEVRKAIVSAVIAQVAAEAEAQSPTARELRQLYEDDPQFFANTARYRVRWWRLPGTGIEARLYAEMARKRLSENGASVTELSSFGLRVDPLLPDRLLPLTKIADYLGPMLAREVQKLKPGSISAIIAQGDGFHILQLLEKRDGQTPPFEEIRPLVEAEFVRRSGERALHEYLFWLRQRAEIVLQPEFD